MGVLGSPASGRNLVSSSSVLRTAVAAALCLVATFASAAPTDDALAAYDRGDYATALRLSFVLRDDANPVALRLLGQMYWLGKGVQQEPRTAIGYLQNAANAGDAPARMLLQDPVIAAFQAPADQRAALLTPLAEKGDRVAQWMLGEHYRYPLYEIEAALRWYRASAAQGFGLAATALGGIYATGFGGAMKIDQGEGLRWYRQAVDLGDGAAMSAFATFHQRGDFGLPKSDSESLAWYKRAVDVGYFAPEFSIAIAYSEGIGTPKDAAEAVRWFQRAVEHGDQRAMTELAAAYRNGTGTAQDRPAAAALYTRLAAMGDRNSLVPLAATYAEMGDNKNALQWYLIAADAGERGAIRPLGEIYAKGKGVERDLVEAAWYYAADEAGDFDVRWKGGIQRVLRMEIDQADFVFNEPRETYKLAGMIVDCSRLVGVAPSRTNVHYGATCIQELDGRRLPVAVCADTETGYYAAEVLEEKRITGEGLAEFVLTNCFGG